MKREDLIELAKQQAAEIARAGHNGWGNTMLALAVALESSVPVGVEGLIADWRDQAKRLRNEVPNLRDGTDKRFFAACDADRAADELEALTQQPAADGYCVTREDGECVSSDPRCMHNKPAAVDEATRRDAERYRWLRDNAGAWEVSRDQSEWTKCGTGEKYRPRVYFTAFGTGYGGMRLDDAIDAAMNRANT